MTDLEYANPLAEFSVKLCAAVEKYKCLHDQDSYHKYARPECEEAWQLVADECDETVVFCKNRWKTLRRCFFKGLKRRGTRYYLHDHLKFLHNPDKKKSMRKSMATFNDETNSTTSDSLQKSQHGDNSNSEKSEINNIKAYIDYDAKSVDSRTTSADESNEIMQQTGEGVFIIDEIEENSFDKEFLDEKRLRYKRSCKRPLDKELIDELAEDEPEDKRYRRIDKHILTSHSASKSVKARMDKLKINLSEKKVETVKDKKSNGSTDSKQNRDFGTQYEHNFSSFDEIFMNSIKTQLTEMNPRQKLNFKRKIYQSLMEVFDDSTDFPNSNETIVLTPKEVPTLVDTTTGELRLMRELVALVQAAKTTPEIVTATDKAAISTPLQSKSPVKLPLPITDNRSKTQTSPLSLSPPADDDDLQFIIDNLDDESDAPLPKTKSTEPTKPTGDDNVVGLPRRILQKVVRVSGPSGSTIVTRDGDKKRVYRIFPKLLNTNGNQSPLTKNGNSPSSFLVSTAKNPQDTRKDSGVGTFYVTSTKNPQDASKISNGISSNTNARPSNNKPSQLSNFLNAGSLPTNSNNTNSAINNHTIFKNVHPANRVLSPTTGYFKMIPTTKSITPSNLPATGITTNAASKVMATKMPMSSMLPPNSNIAAKRIHTVRSGAQIMQRRYSICGPLSGEKANTSLSNSTVPGRNFISTNNGDSQLKSGVSQIQISQPISLNTKAANNQNFSLNINSKSTTIANDFKVQSQKTAQDPIFNKDHISSTQSEQKPILQTAGTVAADDLDPLYVKPPVIKSEPVDE